MNKIKDVFNIHKELFTFGNFTNTGFKNINENFEDYKKLNNTLSKDKIIDYLENLKPLVMKTSISYDIFDNEEIRTSGFIRDNDFLFPIEFIHYLKKYNIGIPLEYENYINGRL